MDALIPLWLAHIVLVAWVVAPMAVLGRRRAAWRWWEALVFVVPYWTWALLMLSPLEVAKSMGNFSEAFHISAAIVIAAAVRVAYGQRPYARVVPVWLLVGVVAVAVGSFFLTPTLSE